MAEGLKQQADGENGVADQPFLGSEDATVSVEANRRARVEEVRG
jgi:hypothetical protein